MSPPRQKDMPELVIQYVSKANGNKDDGQCARPIAVFWNAFYTGILIFVIYASCITAASAGMVKYQHKSGLSFSYPEEWVLREDEEGLYLIPDGVKRANSGMPKEYFFLGMTPAPEITSAEDPMVAAYFEKMINAWAPGSVRAGQTGSVKTGLGPGAVISFTGAPEGIESDILIYVVIRDEEGLYLIHVRDKTASSDAQMGRKIFSSLDLRLRIDPALAGAWVRTERSSSSAGSYDPSQFSTTHLVRYEFDGAGNVTIKSDYSSSSVSDDVATIDNSASYLSGKYSSLGEVLYVEWEDGTEVAWNYSVFPDYNDGHLILKLQDPDTGKDKFYRRSE